MYIIQAGKVIFKDGVFRDLKIKVNDPFLDSSWNGKRTRQTIFL